MITISSLPDFLPLNKDESTITDKPSTTLFTREASPILHLKQENVQIKFRPSLTLGGPFSEGDLYIAENALYFHDNASSQVIMIDYPSILMHALSRGNQTEGEEVCAALVYCQLESLGIQLDENGNEMDEEEEPCLEMELIPSDETKGKFDLLPLAFCNFLVDDVFQALSKCAALHPDMDQEEDDDMENEWFYSAENVDQLTDIGQVNFPLLAKF